MLVSDHKALSPTRVACFVLTVSDSRTLENDTSGQAIATMLEAAGHTVTARKCVRDEPRDVAQTVREQMGKGDAQVIITTGGTGVSRRDSTYEAITGLFDKTLDGFGELFRMLSYQDIGSAAMLSRASAGVAAGFAIFMLPGSPAAVKLAMEKLILPELGHIVRELNR